MVSKLSRIEENEYVISEQLDLSLYEEISRYLTIADIQLVVYSLEALYQLSEIGEETNSKIAETSNTVGMLTVSVCFGFVKFLVIQWIVYIYKDLA